MEELEGMTAPLMNFIATKGESSYIKVIGVGGGGTNAVNHMYREGITGVDFIVCNTDAKSLSISPVTNKIQLGEGLGAGNDPEVAKRCALENTDTIKAVLSENTKMLFITAGMGGGTGTGASPIIAQIAKEIELNDKDVPKILVVAIVTMPFSFEGKARKQQAEDGVKELRKYVDSILIIDNDKVLGGEKLPFRKAFAKADDVLLTAAKSVAEIITVNAYMTIDFRDVNTVMKDSGTALMGAGVAEGENRAIEAMQQAVTSPLLNDTDISDSRNILLQFTCSEDYEITTEEIEETTGYLTSICKKQPTIIWGIGYDEELGEKVRIIVVATGFQTSNAKQLPPISGTGGIIGDNGPTTHALDIVEDTKIVEDSDNEKSEFTLTSPKGEPVQQEKTSPLTNTQSVTQESSTQVHILKMDGDTEDSSNDRITELLEDSLFSEFEVKSATGESDQRIVTQSVVEKKEEIRPVAPKSVQASVLSAQRDASQIHRVQEVVMDRMAAIRNFKKQISTPEGLSVFENEPSYKRQGLVFENIPQSNESETEKTIVDKNGNIAQNTFLYTSVD